MEKTFSPDAIGERLQEIQQIIPAGIQLVAISKFQPVEKIKAAYESGQRLFGESRVQELLDKIPRLPDDISWHFIGHLQTNKVKMLVGKVTLIESVDSEKLLDIIDRESEKAGVASRVLLQVHVAAEETKFGFAPEELLEYFRKKRYEALRRTHICGLMAMATNTDDIDVVRKDFARVASHFREIKEEISPELRGFDIISMGMSGDWPIAIEEGATMIRIGTAIFGAR